MLKDTEDERRTRTKKTRKQQSTSQERKANRSPSVRESDTSRRRHRSSTTKRGRSSKSRKDELKYDRFVDDLKKEIKHHLKQRLRESRFDPVGRQSSQIYPPFIINQATSSLGSPRAYDNTTIITSVSNNGPRSIKLIKNNESKRLTNDVQTILTGPAFKDFYAHFIRSKQHQRRQENNIHKTRSLEESIVLPNEQE